MRAIELIPPPKGGVERVYKNLGKSPGQPGMGHKATPMPGCNRLKEQAGGKDQVVVVGMEF
jgi:hypothetical protein